MSKEIVNKLIKKMPKGYAQLVSDRISMSRQAVYKAIDKADLDHPVIKEMVKLAEEHQQKLRQIEDRIDKIAS